MKVSTWTVKNEGTTGTISATKALVSGSTHFVSGFACSLTMTGYTPEQAEVQINHGTGPTIIFDIDLVSATSYGGPTYSADWSGPTVVTFAHPLQIPAGEQVTASITPSASGCVAKINFWGFTSKSRDDS